jgi:hypothetical protein
MPSQEALPKHLRYQPSPEIVRAHEQWQEALRQASRSLETMGHVRAPEALKAVMMPLMVHIDAFMTMLQGDLASYTETVMGLLHAADQAPEIVVGLHPDEADALAAQIDDIEERVKKVATGLKEESDQRKILDEALGMINALGEAVLSAALDDSELPDDDDDDDEDEEEEGEEEPGEDPLPIAADDGGEEAPLQIT